MENVETRCHVEVTIAVIGGKWKPWILWHLYEGECRYGELRRLTPDISGKMLTQQLRELERDGVIERKAYDEKVPRVEYSFTKYGETLRPILTLLCGWGAQHLKHIRNQGKRKTVAKKRIKGS